jgi:hypothetical protein
MKYILNHNKLRNLNFVKIQISLHSYKLRIFLKIVKTFWEAKRSTIMNRKFNKFIRACIIQKSHLNYQEGPTYLKRVQKSLSFHFVLLLSIETPIYPKEKMIFKWINLNSVPIQMIKIKAKLLVGSQLKIIFHSKCRMIPYYWKKIQIAVL